nr:MAG TPA: RecT protein [Caudoviricetes sp.]
MNVKGGLKNAIAEKNKEVSPVKAMGDLLKRMHTQIEKALPSVITPERFTRIALTAYSRNEKLQECTAESFLGSMMQAAQLGVEPNTPLGQAYLIPYRNKGVMEVQFQLGYRGMIDLAYRSGEVQNIQAHEVYENDTFEYELGLEPKLRHIPALKDRGNVILYYAVFKLTNGGVGFEVMSKEDVEAFAKKKSKTYGTGPWQSDFDAMAKKTLVKRLLKFAPLKSDFVRAVTADETIKSGISENMADLPDETVTIDAETTAPTENADYEEIPMPGDLYTDPETGEVKKA